MKHYRTILTAICCTAILYLPGCYIFSLEYRKILEKDMMAFTSRGPSEESSKLIEEIKNESLKKATDKW